MLRNKHRFIAVFRSLLLTIFVCCLTFLGRAETSAEEPSESLPQWRAPRLVKNIRVETESSSIASVTEMGADAYIYTHSSSEQMLWRSGGTAATTQVLLDLNNEPISPPRALGDKLIFNRLDQSTGIEPWVSDGTPAGTTLLKDIAPAQASSVEYDSVVVAGDYAYFGAETQETGSELWRTDGTPAGTMLIKDLQPGFYGSDPKNLTPLGDLLIYSVFLVGDGTYTHVIMRSNGTPDGTTPVYSMPDNRQLGNFVTAKGLVFFLLGADLWRTDGTAAGTYKLKEFETDVRMLVGANTRAYFAVLNDESGVFDLWRSDGTTAGTVKFGIATGQVGWAGQYNTAGDTLFYTNESTALGNELWATDGTQAGTRLVKDIRPGAASSDPSGLLAGSGGVYFSAQYADNNDSGSRVLWFSDGTAPGTVQMALPSLDPNEGGEVRPAGILENRLIFEFNDGKHGREPWISNGPHKQAELLVDANNVDSASSLPRTFIPANDWVYFRTSDGLWQTDGSEAGTKLFLANRYPEWLIGGELTEFGVSGKLLYFLVDDQVTDELQLWRTDGTQTGTAKLARLGDEGAGQPEEFTDVNGVLYFAEFDPHPRHALWRSDGSVSGTRLVKIINVTGFGSSELSELTAYRGRLFMAASDNVTGVELWTSDGTSAGTVQKRDIRPGSESSTPQELTVCGDRLFFTADDGEHGRELWVSDGTFGGTTMVSDIHSDAAAPGPRELTAVGDQLYFQAIDNAHGWAIWKASCRGAGAEMVRDIDPSTGSTYPLLELTAGNGVLYFNPGQIWMSDGTAAGTHPITNIQMDDLTSTARLTMVDQLLFFTARTNGSWKLFSTDGTAVGTISYFDEFPDKQIYEPAYLSSTPSALYLAADSEFAGNEPFTVVTSLLWTDQQQLYLPEGGVAKHYTVALTSRPSGNVEVKITSDETLEIQPAQITFTPQNWRTPVDVRVRAPDDGIADNTRPAALAHRLTTSDPLLDEEEFKLPVLIRNWRFAYAPSIMR